MSLMYPIGYMYRNGNIENAVPRERHALADGMPYRFIFS